MSNSTGLEHQIYTRTQYHNQSKRWSKQLVIKNLPSVPIPSNHLILPLLRKITQPVNLQL